MRIFNGFQAFAMHFFRSKAHVENRFRIAKMNDGRFTNFRLKGRLGAPLEHARRNPATQHERSFGRKLRQAHA